MVRKLISVDPKKKGFDYGNEFPLLFSLQMNSGEREREREREKHNQSALFACTKLQSALFASTSAVDRELAFAPIAINAVLREIAIDASRDRAIDRDLAFAPIAIDGEVIGLELAKHRAVEPSRALSVKMGAVFVFLVLSFPCSIFQTPENIFRKFF